MHTLRFKVEELVEDQEKYGGFASPGELPQETWTDNPQMLQLMIDPDVSVAPGAVIVVGVIHGSSMGEDGPVPWIMFDQAYREDGTPVGGP